MKRGTHSSLASASCLATVATLPLVTVNVLKVKGSGCSWDASPVPEFILGAGRTTSGQRSGQFSYASYIQGPLPCPQAWRDLIIIFYLFNILNNGSF